MVKLLVIATAALLSWLFIVMFVTLVRATFVLFINLVSASVLVFITLVRSTNSWKMSEHRFLSGEITHMHLVKLFPDVEQLGTVIVFTM